MGDSFTNVREMRNQIDLVDLQMLDAGFGIEDLVELSLLADVAYSVG